MPDERHAIDGGKNGHVCFTVCTGNRMELAAHWHRCQNLNKKRVNTSLLYRERDDPVKERLANWRTRSGTLGSVEERYTGALHGRTSKILATWQIDSYPRQADAYLCLKRAIYRRFERKIGRISCPTFRGKVMSQNGFRAKLCVRETAFDSSIQAHCVNGRKDWPNSEGC